MYSTQWCPYCRKARAHFERHKIAYVEYDIEASAQNRAQFQALKGRGVPLFLVGDKRMQGFAAAIHAIANMFPFPISVREDLARPGFVHAACLPLPHSAWAGGAGTRKR